MKHLFTILIAQLFISSILNADFLKAEWTRQINSPNNNIARYMVFDKNDSFYIYSYKDNKPYLSKFSSNSTFLWSKKQNYISNKTIFKDQYSYLTGSKDSNAFISKFASNEKELWTTYFGGLGIDSFNSLLIDSKDNVYATGFTSGLTYNHSTSTKAEGLIPPTKIIVAKVDSHGTKKWVVEHNNGTKFNSINPQDSGTSLVLDKDNNLYVTGSATWNLPKNSHDSNDGVFLSKFTTDGIHLWIHQYGHKSSKKLLIKEKFLYIAGNDFVMKLNLDGTLIWTLEYNGKIIKITDMIFDNDKDLIVTGSSFSPFGGELNSAEDVFIIKISTDGEILLNKLIGTKENDTSNALGVDSQNNIYLVGNTVGFFDGYTNEVNENGYKTNEIFISKFTEDTTEPLNLSNSSLTYKKRNNSLVSWQLISLPFPAYIKASELNVKQIYGFDFYDKEYFTPIELEPGKGYWVLPNSAETINFSKQTFYDKTELFAYMKKRYDIISRFNRWNLLGTPFDTTVEELKKDVGFTDIITFDSVSYKFITNGNSTIKAGTGFWAK